MKQCSKCGKLKKESDFPKDRTRKDGLHQRCKACKNAYSRQRYDTSRGTQENKAGRDMMKRCSGCEKLKDKSAFSKDRTKKDGLYHLCKVCRSAYRRQHNKDNRAIQKSDTNVPMIVDYDYDNKHANGDLGVLGIVHAGVKCGSCSVCGESIMGYIPGYLHGQPVCKGCIIINLKTMFKKKKVRK